MEDDMVSHLQCDVELQITSKDDGDLNKLAAAALRKAAVMIETGQLETGFIDMLNDAGRKIGTIYLDYSEGDIFSVDTPN